MSLGRDKSKDFFFKIDKRAKSRLVKYKSILYTDGSDVILERAFNFARSAR